VATISSFTIVVAFWNARSETFRMQRVIAVLFLALGVAMSMGSGRAAERAWNRQAAATYLDERMDEWFAKAEKLRTGDGQASCVSCHTVVPYALARPVLRRAMNVSVPTPQEVRLVDEASRRVRTWSSNQHAFEFSQDQDESRGTEAVLYALILAAADTGAREQTTETTRLAMTHLWQAQRPDGAWVWLDVGLEPFESVGAAYQGAALAALAIGRAKDIARQTDAGGGLAKLVEYLRRKYPTENLHNRVWGLLASASLSGVLTTADRDDLVAELERVQRDDGGWSLDGLGGWRWNTTSPPFQSPGTRDLSLVARSDGYATGLIVYALRQNRVSAHHRAVKRGLEWLRANQNAIRLGDREWLAWRAHSLNYDREHGGAHGASWPRLFMSDAATAFASLVLAGSE
jgi:squalene-hopene/tetraprenyl-beta-curcumene cyclase